VIKKDDDRPIWVLAWGGSNTLALALWKLHRTLPEREFDAVIEKLRVYTISDQDDSGPWMRNKFPDLFYIVSPGYHSNSFKGYYHATWTGIGGDASPTTDPDGDELIYNWFLYYEPGSYLLYNEYFGDENYQLDIVDSDKPLVSFTAPSVEKPQDMHIILEVTDNGTPALTHYQRVIVNILP